MRLPASASLPLASCWPRPQQLLPVSATGGGRRRCFFLLNFTFLIYKTGRIVYNKGRRPVFVQKRPNPSTGRKCCAHSTHRGRLPPVVGRPAHPASGKRDPQSFVYGHPAADGGGVLHPAHEASAGAAVPGYAGGGLREERQGQRPLVLPDAGGVHGHPGGHGQSGGRCGGGVCGRCRRGVLDVGDGSAGRIHLLCGVHAGPEIQAARPPLRRLAGRPGLLSPHPRGAQTGQEAPLLGGGLPVRRVGPHLLVRHQSGGQQLGERGVPECVLHPAAGHDAGADGACGGHRPAEGGHRQEPRRHGPHHGGLLLRHDPLDHPHPSAPAARCLRPHFLGGTGPASGRGRRLWRCGDERHQAGPFLQRGRFRFGPLRRCCC